jgi:hypothetical protein
MGVKICIVCNARSDDKSTKRSYHEFPRDPRYREIWIDKILGASSITTRLDKKFVCSYHFEDTDFHVTLTGVRTSRLEANAVPSKNLCSRSIGI